MANVERESASFYIYIIALPLELVTTANEIMPPPIPV